MRYFIEQKGHKIDTMRSGSSLEQKRLLLCIFMFLDILRGFIERINTKTGFITCSEFEVGFSGEILGKCMTKAFCLFLCLKKMQNNILVSVLLTALLFESTLRLQKMEIHQKITNLASSNLKGRIFAYPLKLFLLCGLVFLFFSGLSPHRAKISNESWQSDSDPNTRNIRAHKDLVEISL